MGPRSEVLACGGLHLAIEFGRLYLFRGRVHRIHGNGHVRFVHVLEEAFDRVFSSSLVQQQHPDPTRRDVRRHGHVFEPVHCLEIARTTPPDGFVHGVQRRVQHELVQVVGGLVALRLASASSASSTCVAVSRPRTFVDASSASIAPGAIEDDGRRPPRSHPFFRVRPKGKPLDTHGPVPSEPGRVPGSTPMSRPFPLELGSKLTWDGVDPSLRVEDEHVDLETLLLRPNNRRGSHWIPPRPLDGEGTIGDRNLGYGAFFPTKAWLVAYGAAKFASGGHGEVAMPTSRAFKVCVQRLKTAPVDEFGTTMAHAGRAR
eukprot:scaffold633_cov321-Pavlova_lutheri.AAC.3